MKLLLDTHIVLWIAQDSRQLPASVRTLLAQETDDFVFSAVNIWEIAVKRALRRADFVVEPHVLRQELLESGYVDLSVTSLHALAVLSLPPIHKDPFDRLLVAQATVEGMVLLTADPIIARYPGPICLV